MSSAAVVRIAGNGAASGNDDGMIAALAVLHADCFAPLPETPWSETAFRTLLNIPTTHAWVAGPGEGPHEGQIQGLLMVRELAGDWEVLTICVDPRAWRGGIARTLFAEFLAFAGDDANIVLEVAVDNDPAIALYRAFGFQPVGRRPGYYAGDSAERGRVDALILARLPREKAV